ncbi:molybdate ABC transporter substrate-binding protein [Oceanidesulfovibrio marinus]|uniref:Molybdate ABC transporter substrate-binding protein n=1 Tax=Oceanidesulfovibrio marinus TaxID=370038 RepID=A0A6P1ZHP4_9BACT|nr:molybdate ABC transporter substrate-binding protein [Oceanidesulfovibrio marinus]QJT09582.1 molybdate ABC transporter substrate-binding protein [Oceanidesulfovibrio marinus]TVM33793.1 molybdate ABC transporter substrate-binding protein [Oceanidesulfovibrio marinus]
MKRVLNSLILSCACMVLVLAPLSAHAEELIVSAAASLTDAFTDIEPGFEKANPGVDVVMNFAASGALYRQIEQGAPADVFASANPKWMQKAVDNGFVDKANVVTFAQNALVLAVPADNPAGVKSLDDLKGDAVKSIGIGTPETVPAGQYAKSALTAQKLYTTLEPKMIFGESVRQVLDYLSRGEVDCGFVYKTDAVKAGDAVAIVAEIPLEKPVSYPIAVLKNSTNSKMAQAFVDYVQSEEGMTLLEARGFKRP